MCEDSSDKLLRSSASPFDLGAPSRAELDALMELLALEHTADKGTCVLIDSVDGYGTMEALKEGIEDAWQRDECFVMRQSHPADETAAKAAGLIRLGDRQCEVLMRPDESWILPAFATVCVQKAGCYRPPREPYLELIWVSPAARRRGIGQSMVRRVCEAKPAIKNVRSCLPEALPFWDAPAIRAHVSRSEASNRPRPPVRPLAMDAGVLQELARLRHERAGDTQNTSEG